MPTKLTVADLRVDATYKGKRSGTADRVIVYLNPASGRVQYDSDSVGMGQQRPMVPIEDFLRWAKEEVPDADED